LKYHRLLKISDEIKTPLSDPVPHCGNLARSRNYWTNPLTDYTSTH